MTSARLPLSVHCTLCVVSILTGRIDDIVTIIKNLYEEEKVSKKRDKFAVLSSHLSKCEKFLSVENNRSGTQCSTCSAGWLLICGA